MSDRRSVTMIVNGQSYTREVETRLTLADFIRHEINLTGTHLGCEHGVCGACTILLDGLSARSCLMLAVQARASRRARMSCTRCSRPSWTFTGCSAGFALRAC